MSSSPHLDLSSKLYKPRIQSCKRKAQQPLKPSLSTASCKSSTKRSCNVDSKQLPSSSFLTSFTKPIDNSSSLTFKINQKTPESIEKYDSRPFSGVIESQNSVEYNAYLKSPFSFIDRVIENPFTEEFIYLKSNGPYDLEIIPHNQVDPNEYFTMSRTGVTHIYKGDTDFTSLDQWEREYFLFKRMMQVSFFGKFRVWKAFYYWKKIIRRQKTKNCQKNLANNLFVLNNNLRNPLIALRELCYEVSQWEVNKIDPKHTYKLDEFIFSQDSQRKVVAQQLQSLNSNVKHIVLKASAKDLNDFLVKNGFRRSEETKLERIEEDNEDYNKKTTHAERAAIRTECRKLTKYIRLSDYLVVDTLVTLALERTAEVLSLVKRPNNVIPEIIRVQERAKNRGLTHFDVSDLLVIQGSQGTKDSRTPLFVINMLLTNDYFIKFEPPLANFQDSMATCLFKAVQTMMTPNRLISDEEFLQYTQVNLDDGDEDASLDNDLGEMVFREEYFINMVQNIKAQFEFAFDDAFNYAKDFHDVNVLYQENMNADISALRNSTIETFQNVILMYKEQIQKFDLIPVRANIGIIQVDSSSFKALLLPAPRNSLNEVSQLLPKIASEKCTELSEILLVANERLAEVPASVEEFVKFKSFLQQTHEQQEDLETSFDFINALTSLMREHRIQQTDLDKMNFEKLLQMKRALKTATELSEFSIDEKTGRFVKELESEIPVLKGAVNDLANEIKVEMISNPLSNVEEVIEYLNEREQRLLKLEEQSKKFKFWQKELGMTVDYYAELADLKVDLDVKQKLWVSLRDWKQITEGWMESKFEEIKADDVLNKVQIFAKVVQLSILRLKDNPVVEVLKSRVEEFQLTMPVVVDLRNDHLRERHWKEIQELIDYDIYNDKNFVLGKLIELKVLEHQEKIREIAHRADQEFAQREMLDKVITMWEETEFDVIQFKDSKDIHILGSLDDIVDKLDESLVYTNTILASTFCEFIHDEVMDWRKKLILFQDTLSEWIKCQKTWMYFFNIFSGPEISKQLPDAYSDFVKVTKSWKDIMRRINDHPNVMHKSSGFQALHEILASHNVTLEKINKKLNMFLDAKRREFPRFFFLSKDDLLEILAESKNVQVVQRHVSKFFDNINKLDFGNDTTNTLIEAMVSAEGERVLLYKIRAKGAVEAWLSALEGGMIKAVRRELKNGLLDYERTPQRLTWLLQKPGQVVLTVSQIVWARGCENAMNSNRPIDALRRYLSILRSQLSELVRAVRGDVAEIQRKKIISLITTDVHSAEITEDLIEKAIDNPNDFEWQKVLRFYWDKEDDNCLIRQVNAPFIYGYEYLGVASRLVVTPLTDRCWMTLTGALQLKLGGFPQGPAGTGKTESVKDLARLLGLYCVFYNGSEQLECKSMGELICGVAQAGVWMCVDEFNRINVEVLSVIALQVRQLHDSLRAELSELEFEGHMIKLKQTCGVFVTMNPDYAARSELPDNLKVLFRPVSMMIPNYYHIAKVMLYSQGFETADVLAQKMCKLYKLASEQLSQQRHYDFGMRAHKSILVIAGSLHHNEPDAKEENILIRAMLESNLPKFLAEDIPLFNAIVRDLFPDTNFVPIEHQSLHESIENILVEEKLQVVPRFISKSLQLFETLNVRFGVMLIGNTGTGKSTIYKTLAKAITNLKNPKQPQYQKVNTYILNPKSIDLDELFGHVHPATLEWNDGLASKIVKEVVEEASEDYHWIVFDGPVDAFWIENMNSALDDSATLCLANSARIKLTQNMRFLFEVDNLTYASPATVSRCGMVYISESDIGWQPYITSWLENNLPPDIDISLKEHLSRFFDTKIVDGLSFVKEYCVQPIPTSDLAKVVSFCSFFQTLFCMDSKIDFRKPPEDIIPLLEYLFVFAYAWSIGGNLDDESTVKFDKFIKEKFPEIRFPKDLIYEYYVDTPRNNWIPWSNNVPKFQYDPQVPFHQIIVPTTNTVRYSFIIRSLLSIDRPIFLTGSTGVGKSVIVANTFNQISEQMSLNPVTIYFSAQTSSKKVQQIIESRLERKRDVLLGASMGYKVVIFVDDVNMPTPDDYNSQAPIELLRQFLDFKGFYDRKKLFWKDIQDTTLICAAGPPGGGRHNLTPRFIRHFNLLCFTSLSDEILRHIFGSVLNNYVSTFKNESFSDLVTPIVNSTIQLYRAICKEVLPTPSKSHYTYNLRDIAKVFQGILSIKPENCLTSDTMINLWIHETMRVFHDRLINNVDRTWVTNHIIHYLNKNFAMPATHQQIFEQQNIIFGDFMTEPPEKRYIQITDFKSISNYLDEQLIRLDLTDMNLVFFEDAINHLSRISRILSQPRGNALLVGVGGSGKQSMTRLAAALAGMEVMQCGRNNYGYKEFREDFKKLLLKGALMDGKPVVFLLTESNITDDRFLEDINNLLNAGEVPNLFDVDETNKIIDDLLPLVKEMGISEKRDNIWSVFVQRVQINIHIVLCMSPLGDNFRQRSRMFPSLINCTTIDWYSNWPSQALKEVSQRFLENVVLPSEEIRTSLVNIAVTVHTKMEEACQKFYDVLSRHVYITPKSYLDLIQLYLKMLNNRRTQLNGSRHRLKQGLQKLYNTNKMVVELEAKLKELQPKYKQAAVETESLLKKVEIDQEQARKIRTIVQNEEKLVKEDQERVAKLTSEAENDLNAVKPFLDEANEAVSRLDRQDVAYMRSYPNPPYNIRLVAEAICLLLKENTEWTNAQRVFQNPRFLTLLTTYDKDNMDPIIIQNLQKKYMEHPLFTEEKMASASAAALSMCKWVRAMVEYDRVRRIVQPKQKELQRLSKQLAEATARLQEKQLELKKSDEAVTALRLKCDLTMKEKNKYNALCAQTRNRLSRASKLTSGLADESIRWGEDVEDLEKEIQFLIGDVFISAACISYLGPFTGPFRRELVDDWEASCVEQNIPISSNFSLINTLGNPITIRDWHLKYLPTDNVSIESALIFSCADRWPLLIDPQCQAIRWIRELFKSKIIIIRHSDSNLISTVEFASSSDRPILIEDVGETIDPRLDNIMTRTSTNNTNKDGSKPTTTDNTSGNFAIYLQTKLPNPHFLPEVSIIATIINFTVTKRGLCDQLLGDVVCFECVEIEEKKNELMTRIADDKKQLQVIEERIITYLSRGPEYIIDDDQLINQLQSSKDTANLVKDRVSQAEHNQQIIEETREKYIPVALRGAIIYFVIADLAAIDPMYQFSLPYFQRLFNIAMKHAEPNQNLPIRIESLISSITEVLYKNICRGLFETHKNIFAFLIGSSILREKGEISSIEWDYFIRGSHHQEQHHKTNPSPDIISSELWKSLIGLQQTVPQFQKLSAIIEKNTRAWQNYIDDESPEEGITLPEPYRTSLTPFQKLILLKCFHEHTVTRYITKFVVYSLGPNFLETPRADLEEVFRDADRTTPIIFVLSPGADPLEMIGQYARKKRFWDKLKLMSLGRGMGPTAAALIDSAKTKGQWVLLQNCHLVPSFLPILEKIVDDIHENVNSVHEDFRLMLTSKPCSFFPVSILQNSVKLTNEPPKGIKANLERSYQILSHAEEKTFEKCAKFPEFKKLLFGLSFFHAIIQERRKFGQLGWNIPYQFNDSDLETSATILYNTLENNQSPDIPWKALNYIIGEINYGGRVTDDWDRRCLLTLLEKYFRKEFLHPDFRFSNDGTYYVPEGDLDTYKNYIKQLPMTDPPHLFSMHRNALITHLQKETNIFMDTILVVQPKLVTADSGKSTDQTIIDIINELQSQIPTEIEKSRSHESNEQKEDEINSLSVVLFQEISRYNVLLTVIRSSLENLKSAILGEILMSTELDKMYFNLFNNQVPKKWKDNAYPSTLPLFPWVEELSARISFIEDWLLHGAPASFWLPGFFYPQSFTTAVLQNHARKYHVAIDSLTFMFHVLDIFDPDQLFEPAQDGVFVHGLYLDGARWDTSKRVLSESNKGVLYSPLPIIHFLPQANYSHNPSDYSTPVYKTPERAGVLSTTGESTNYILPLQLATDKPSEHWILKGVAALCQIPKK